VRERVAAALTAGIDPAGSTAAAILDDLVQRYAETFQTTDTPKYRNALLRRLARLLSWAAAVAEIARAAGRRISYLPVFLEEYVTLLTESQV
jgi:hypothetical protein